MSSRIMFLIISVLLIIGAIYYSIDINEEITYAQYSEVLRIVKSQPGTIAMVQEALEDNVITKQELKHIKTSSDALQASAYDEYEREELKKARDSVQ